MISKITTLRKILANFCTLTLVTVKSFFQTCKKGINYNFNPK